MEPAKFENPPLIGKDDFISRLPSDCADAVLVLLNQEELDNVSRVNQKLHQSAEFARPRAIKTRARDLTISQTNARHVHVSIELQPISIDLPNRSYVMYIDQSKDLPSAFRKLRSNEEMAIEQDIALETVAPVDRQIMKHLKRFTRRFTFDNLTFDTIEIDESFLEDFKRIESPKWLSFTNCVFDKEASEEFKASFISCLLAAKPAELVLFFPRDDDVSIFNFDFIRSFADQVDNPRLKIHPTKQRITVNSEELPVLLRFRTLHAMCLVLTPQDLLQMVLTRLDTEEPPCNDGWEFSVTGPITEAMLQAIDDDKYSLFSRGGASMVIKGPHFNCEYGFGSKDGSMCVMANFRVWAAAISRIYEEWDSEDTESEEE